MKYACLEVNSFRGISIGAVHWYGTIVISNSGCYERIKLQRKMTDKEISLLNKQEERSANRRGMLTDGFDSEEQVIEYGRKEFDKILHGGVLFLGSNACLSAWKRVIMWPPQVDSIVAKMNKISDEFKDINGYEGNYEKASNLDEEWMKLYKTLLSS